MTISIHQPRHRNTESSFSPSPDLDLGDPDFDELEALLEEELDDPDDLDTSDPDPSTDLDELELLLAESTIEADLRKAAKRQQYCSGNPIPWTEAPKYQALFSCAVFTLTSCSHCGSETSIFSHFAEYQEFSAKFAGKPNCWKRLTTRPSILSRPRFIPVITPGCSCCVSNTDAINIYTTPPPQKQLNLPFMTEGDLK